MIVASSRLSCNKHPAAVSCWRSCACYVGCVYEALALNRLQIAGIEKDRLSADLCKVELGDRHIYGIGQQNLFHSRSLNCCSASCKQADQQKRNSRFGKSNFLID